MAVSGKKKSAAMFAAAAAITALFLNTGSTEAYLTSFAKMNNTVSVGQNTTEIEEDFPDPTPVPAENDPEYRKEVWVSNKTAGSAGSGVDCFVRLAVGYSHSDIAGAVVLNDLDTENWTLGDDGFYYYRRPLKEGESTTPLFSGFRIDSSKVDPDYLKIIPSFEIQIYEESIQAAGFTEYEKAWESFHHSV